MEITRFTPSTSGEHLFHLLVNEVIGVRTPRSLRNLSILEFGGRSDDFSNYFIGVTALNLLARLIKKAERISNIDDASLHHGSFVHYLQETIEMTKQGDDLVDRVARLSLDAARNSKRPIKDSVKKKVRENRTEVPCYLCGIMCSHQSDDPRSAIMYEHIWPSSYGGDSVAENLLPACWKCNEKKDDMLLWHTGAIFSVVLKPEPSEEEIKSIGRREKIARRIQDIIRIANEGKLSLKDAALALGPANFSSISPLNAADAIDYFNFSFS